MEIASHKANYMLVKTLILENNDLILIERRGFKECSKNPRIRTYLAKNFQQVLILQK